MSIPQYARIKTALRERIEHGELSPGDRVPSENQLLAEFAVSRMTARRALLELADEGLLQRIQGPVSYTHLTLPTTGHEGSSRWSRGR